MQPRSSVPADQAGSLIHPLICKRRGKALWSTKRLHRAIRNSPEGTGKVSVPRGLPDRVQQRHSPRNAGLSGPAQPGRRCCRHEAPHCLYSVSRARWAAGFASSSGASQACHKASSATANKVISIQHIHRKSSPEILNSGKKNEVKPTFA